MLTELQETSESLSPMATSTEPVLALMMWRDWFVAGLGSAMLLFGLCNWCCWVAQTPGRAVVILQCPASRRFSGVCAGEWRHVVWIVCGLWLFEQLRVCCPVPYQRDSSQRACHSRYQQVLTAVSLLLWLPALPALCCDCTGDPQDLTAGQVGTTAPLM